MSEPKEKAASAKYAMLRTVAEQYMRVGIDYFKLVDKQDRYGTKWNDIKKWSKGEIRQDHGTEVLDLVPKFDDFILVPDNNGVAKVIDDCYNMYKPVPFRPAEGETKWTHIMLDQIFGNQMEQALKYLQCLYQHPKRPLPVLVLVSKRRSTGKSTFLDWLNGMFGMNMVMIDPDVIGGNFNSEYAAANIIGIDETIIERKTAVEKIKALATKKTISVNMKFVAPFQLPFYGKIIMASNNEKDFMRIDQEEIRFWVRKLGKPKVINHDILRDCIAEIPAFMHELNQRPALDFSKSRMLLTPEEIKNEWLQDVVHESRPNLYFNLRERFRNWFDEEQLVNEGDYIIARTVDIKDLWFRNSSSIDVYYLRKILKEHFKAEHSTRNYINAGMNLTKVSVYGKGFVITRQMLFDDE